MLGNIGKGTVEAGIDKITKETIPAAQQAGEALLDHAGATGNAVVDHAQEQVALDVAATLGAAQTMLDKLVVDLNRTIDRLNGAKLVIVDGGFELRVPPLAER